MGEGALPPSAPSSRSPFSSFSETKKYELHIGLFYLKFIISRVANSVINGLDPKTRRNERVLGKGAAGSLPIS